METCSYTLHLHINQISRHLKKSLNNLFLQLERHDYLFVTVQRSSGSVTAHANANRSLLNNEFIPLSSLHEPK